MADNKSTKRNAEWRERQTSEGKSELRGVFVKREHHDEIKSKARLHAEQLEKGE